MMPFDLKKFLIEAQVTEALPKDYVETLVDTLNDVHDQLEDLYEKIRPQDQSLLLNRIIKPLRDATTYLKALSEKY